MAAVFIYFLDKSSEEYAPGYIYRDYILTVDDGYTRFYIIPAVSGRNEMYPYDSLFFGIERFLVGRICSPPGKMIFVY